MTPNSHGIVFDNGKLFVVFIHPKKDWKNKNTPLIHWMNTEHKDRYKGVFKYTYKDEKDNQEVWKKERKESKRYKKMLSDMKSHDIFLSGFNLTSTNKLRSSTIKEIRYLTKL